jgi:hypothetical protein
MNIKDEYNLNIPQQYIDRVFMWNEERELLNHFDGDLEFRLLNEELDELQQAEEQGDIYEQVDAILDICVVFIGSCIKASLHKVNLQDNLKSYKVFESIVETAFESITKLGYEPKCAFNECLLEIESRTGRIVNGKFSKWREGDKEFTGNYKANYELCLLK